MSRFKDEHVITRQGKPLVLYAGLLDEAHRMGLQSIETNLVGVPNMESESYVCHARATMQDGKFFDGIGDASPHNVGKNIVPHIIRMAETRAKARALRDAINVSDMEIADDPPGEEEPANQPAKPRRNAPQRKGELSVIEGNASGEEKKKITKEQLKNLVETARPHFSKKQLATAQARWQEYTRADYDEALEALREMSGQKKKANQSE